METNPKVKAAEAKLDNLLSRRKEIDAEITKLVSSEPLDMIFSTTLNINMTFREFAALRVADAELELRLTKLEAKVFE